jgi:hypothetical protein
MTEVTVLNRPWPSSSAWWPDGEIHYLAGANRASFGGGSGAAAQITAWVQAHFTAETVGGVSVYDLTRAR